jgi:rhodanese-related sulfurtransferase
MSSRTLQIFLLLGVSCVFGLIRQAFPNALAWKGQWPTSNANAQEAYQVFVKPGDPPFLGLSEAITLHKTAGTIFLDARTPTEFSAGRIPGARNLPFYQLETFQDAALSGATADTEMVVYCEGIGCELSFLLGRELQGAGYSRIKIFYGGYPEWVTAGLPIEKGI